MVFPNYDRIKSIDNYPTINRATNKRFFDLWMAFDEKYYPDLFKGGLWLNNGLSSVDGEHLQDWEVDMSTCTINYQ